MKQDMSYDCELAYFTMFLKRDNKEITEEEFQEWFKKHCENCCYMYEICMYGE